MRTAIDELRQKLTIKQLMMTVSLAVVFLAWCFSKTNNETSATGVCPVPLTEEARFFCLNSAAIESALKAIAEGITNGFSADEISLIRPLYQYCQGAANVLPALTKNLRDNLRLYTLAHNAGCVPSAAPVNGL